MLVLLVMVAQQLQWYPLSTVIGHIIVRQASFISNNTVCHKSTIIKEDLPYIRITFWEVITHNSGGRKQLYVILKVSA